jgi:2-octaprenyl-6-methoxyphenol hydroxylase
MSHFNVIIVGGGLTGICLAVALQNSAGLRVALVDNQLNFTHHSSSTHEAERDQRSLALAPASKNILTALGVWPQLAVHAGAIETVHVSEQGKFGSTRIKNTQLQLPALGYIVPIHILMQCLMERLLQQKHVTLLPGRQLHRLDTQTHGAHLQLEHQGQLEDYSADLVVAADGSDSAVREQAQIATKQYNYEQTAIVANVGVEHMRQVAYERFTQSGPLALLPLQNHSYSLVWTLKTKQAEALLDLKEASFLQRLQQTFGYRLGRFRWLGQRQSFPLKLTYALANVAQRVVLIGNAAHSLHPIAGQGFNLGLRDVAALAEVLQQTAKQYIGSHHFLQQYEQSRKKDQTQMIWFTDGLVKIFSNQWPLIAGMRSLALLGLDITQLQNKLAYKTMGYVQPLTNLAAPQ